MLFLFIRPECVRNANLLKLPLFYNDALCYEDATGIHIPHTFFIGREAVGKYDREIGDWELAL